MEAFICSFGVLVHYPSKLMYKLPKDGKGVSGPSLLRP